MQGFVPASLPSSLPRRETLHCVRVYRAVLGHVHTYKHNATIGRIHIFTVTDDAMVSDQQSTDFEHENECLKIQGT